MIGKLVNKSELAEIVGKSERTLTTWAKNGMPLEVDGGRGAQNQYDTGAVIQWMVEQEISRRIQERGGSETEFYDYETERARLTHHQANKASLEERVLDRSLRPTEEVEQEWTDLVMNCRAKLLSVPTKSAHQLIGVSDLSEAQEILEELVHEALSELSIYDADSESSATVYPAAEAEG